MYTLKYERECQFLWENFVPNQGKSNVLEAELIRVVEQLRHEAQFNLNCNWNSNFIEYCSFLREYLKETSKFIDLIEEKGNYAREYYDGYSDMDLDRIAYVEDDIYDQMLDEIIELYYLANR